MAKHKKTRIQCNFFSQRIVNSKTDLGLTSQVTSVTPCWASVLLTSSTDEPEQVSLQNVPHDYSQISLNFTPHKINEYFKIKGGNVKNVFESNFGDTAEFRAKITRRDVTFGPLRFGNSYRVKYL